jgi:tetratricopeptide (TPR) repeat protein
LGPSQTCSQDTPTYDTEDLDDELEVEHLFTERYGQEGSSMVLDEEFPGHAPGNLVQLLSQLGISVGPTVEKDEDHPTREELRTEATSDGRTLGKWQHHCTRMEDSVLPATDATNAKANDLASSLYIGIGIFSNSRRQASRLSWSDYAFKYRVAWPREAEQLKAKLSNSQAQVLPITQKVSVLQKLARTYFNLNLFDSSLEMQQQILVARKSQEQINPNELVIIYLEIVDLYLSRVDFRTAAKVHSAIHFQIQKKNLSPKHPIHLFSSYLYAFILYCQSKYREGEKIIRSVVQITYGWNNLFFIRALQLLGWFMDMNSSVSLAYIENSYRFNLDNIGGRNRIVDYRSWYDNMQDLLRALISQGDYEASDKLCAYIIKRVTLMDDDIDYIETQRLQAKIWYHQGKLSESCNLLWKLLNDLVYSGKYDANLVSTKQFSYDLALVQEKIGDDLEALKWYRKCLEVEIRVYGLQNLHTLDTCEYIGDCYERLGRYEDALRFYEKVGERLRNSFGSEHDSVKRIEKEIEWTRERMNKAREKVGSVEDTDGDEDMDCDQGTDMEDVGSGANQEMGEEMDCDSGSDLGWNEAEDMAHDDPQDDILQYFDWDAFFDCPTPSFYGLA